MINKIKQHKKRNSIYNQVSTYHGFDMFMLISTYDEDL